MQDRDRFMAHVEPHLAAFWDLRLIEGYGAGLPRRLTTMPFDERSLSPHDLDIGMLREPPWRLLAALNVKYVVEVDQSLWYNPAPGGTVPPLDVQRLRVLENPHPVAPRAFFAARVSPAGASPRLLGDTGQRPPPADPPIVDPRTHSIVEGWTAERAFPTTGTLDAAFDGDRVRVQVDPAGEDRFLVLNERYYPGWRATVDGRPTEILPTNLVMRGLIVPAGATTIEMQYVPLVFSGDGLALLAFGLAISGLSWWGLRYAVRRTSPTTCPEISSPAALEGRCLLRPFHGPCYRTAASTRFMKPSAAVLSIQRTTATRSCSGSTQMMLEPNPSAKKLEAGALG